MTNYLVCNSELAATDERQVFVSAVRIRTHNKKK